MNEHLLANWADGAAKSAIVSFVARVATEGSAHFVPPAARVAVFDNDGTLWSEKPMPIELGFILQRLATMAEKALALRTEQPWKAAYEKTYAWFGEAVTKHYHGDDSDVKVLIRGMLKAFEGTTVEQYGKDAAQFVMNGQHPTLQRPFRDCAYVPMVELLRYLQANGFTNLIASAGDRDFMRAVTFELYGVPPQRVVGSSSALRYVGDGGGGSVVYAATPDIFDDGPSKPVRIWSRIGRRPILACGNSNGDIEMLRYTGGNGRSALRVLVAHDDAAREFSYVAGAEKSLELARAEDWTVVSIKNDWTTVFA